MKKLIFIILLCVILPACSAKQEDSIDPIVENKAPEAPSLNQPEDNLFCTTNKLEFSWLPVLDPEKDLISYIFEISSTPNFSTTFIKTELSTLSLNAEVNKGQNYYWRVTAKDEKGNYSNTSIIRTFYTEDLQSANSLPSVPEKILPVDDVISGTEVELAWQSTDPDNDELQYDLFFGTSTSPQLLANNLSEGSYFLENLTPSTTYYWKIVVRDGQTGKTIGQTWNFSTP